jgi:hypothetical protein
MTRDAILSTCWRRIRHFSYLVDEMEQEGLRIAAAVEWASNMGAPTEKLMECVNGYRELMADMSRDVSQARAAIEADELDLDELRDDLDTAIASVNAMISQRTNFIASVVFHIKHPNKKDD